MGQKENEARRKDFDGLKRRWVTWPAGLLFFLFLFFSGNCFFFSCSILLDIRGKKEGFQKVAKQVGNKISKT
jgi:hypothetical protein